MDNRTAAGCGAIIDPQGMQMHYVHRIMYKTLSALQNTSAIGYSRNYKWKMASMLNGFRTENCNG